METNEQSLVSIRLAQLKEIFAKAFDEIKDSLGDEGQAITQFVNQVLAAKDLKLIEEEVLTVQMLASAVREYRVANSNQVVVYKKEKEDEIVVSFSYAKDKNLLPEDENKHVAFVVKSLDAALAKMFGNKDLIVLK